MISPIQPCSVPLLRALLLVAPDKCQMPLNLQPDLLVNLQVFAAVNGGYFADAHRCDFRIGTLRELQKYP